MLNVVLVTLQRTASILAPEAGVPNPRSLAQVFVAAVAFVPAVGTDPVHPVLAHRLDPIVEGDSRYVCWAFLNAADIADCPSVALAFFV